MVKHPDSETLTQLKEKAETDPMKAIDDLLDLVFNPPSGSRKSGASTEPQEA